MLLAGPPLVGAFSWPFAVTMTCASGHCIAMVRAWGRLLPGVGLGAIGHHGGALALTLSRVLQTPQYVG